MNKFTFFLIDDDVDDQEIFCTVMESIAPASQCVIAQNGQVAFDMINSGKVTPDIIFLDLNMPLMNGRQFLQAVDQVNIVTDVPIVVLSTSSELNTKSIVLQLGAKQFITKPDRFSEWEVVLKNQIEELINVR